MNHFIEKMTVDLNINKRKEAYDFQNKVSDLFKKRLEKLTEEILDEFSNPSVVIQIPSLEIDLGNIRSKFFEVDFLQNYKKQLRAALSKQAKRSRPLTSIETSSAETFSNQAVQQNQLEILVFFLENGRLSANAPKNLNLNELLQQLLSSQKALTLQRLKPLMKQKKVIHRLVYSFSTQNTEQLLEYFVPKSFLAIKTAMQNVFSLFKNNSNSTRQQKLHKQLLLITMELLQQSVIKTGNFNPNLTDLNTAFLKILPTQWQQTTTPIYEASFSLQQRKTLQLNEIEKMPYKQVKHILRQAENRYQVITQSTQNELFAIIDILSGKHYRTIRAVIKRTILYQSKSINQKMLENIVWSSVFEYLIAIKLPSTIRVSTIKKELTERINRIENNPIIIHKTPEQFAEKVDFKIKDILTLPYSQIKERLQQSDNQHQVIIQSADDEFFTIIATLAGESFEAIQQFIKQVASIDKKMIKHIVWSATLEYLIGLKSPTMIDISTIEKTIKNRIQTIENNQAIINKTQEKFVEEQEKLQKTIHHIENKTAEVPQLLHLNYRPEDILEIYLLNGYFIQAMESHEVLLANMLDNQPRQLRILLTRIGKTTAVIERLTKNISLKTLQRLTETLTPKSLFVSTLQKNSTKKQSVVLYQIVIKHQLKYGKVESTLLFSTLIDNWNNESDLEQFISSIKTDFIAANDTDYLPIIADYLAANIVINPSVEDDEALLNATRYLDFLTQFVENPTNNWWSKNLSKTEFNQHFQTVIKYYPNAVKTAFHKITAQKNAATILTDLLDETNLTVLMNIIEPNLFGFISTIILTFNDFFSKKESWELTLSAYINSPKPLNINIFTQQSYLQFAKKANQTTTEIQQILLEYTDKQIQLDQHRFHALKQMIRNDIRFKQQPELLTEPKPIDIPTTENQPSASTIEIISYYLKYNTLPQEYHHFTATDIIRTIKVQGIENLNMLKIALRKILENPTYNKKLNTLPESILTTLVQTLQPKIGLSILPFLADLKQVIEPKVLTISLLKVVNEITILTHKAAFVQHFIVSILDTLSATVNFTPQESLKAIIEALADKPQQSNIVKQLRRVLARMNTQANEITVEDKPVPVVEKSMTPLKDTAIYIENAGVVMLNVFFPHLFKMFNLTEKREFKDLESACRAAYMIHYIATGNPTPFEHQLILSKIMCGIPIAQPINAVITLTEEEQTACNHLIQAGIKRWKKMQNSSVEGFRNSFLKREGKLVKISKGWTLTMEQKPFDLMLKTLPWGFSMVRFGWMDDTIYVEWAY